MSDTDANDPLARNRLGEEGSPYLQQHADNPVNWQPWDETALKAARERDLPIFLSVGYASCHWCHVMAEESFEDETVAALLNEHFVPVKVDREERPDVDRIYQTLAAMMGGRGGWPLSVWLTPDQKPFYVGTYFPTEPRRGMPGFVELLERTRDSFQEEREEVEQRGEQWRDAIAGELESTPDEPGETEPDVVETAANAAMRGADREHGGFGTSGPKFPQTGRLELLARVHERTGRTPFREVLTETLDAMAAGGIYDHVGGGFHRYSTDREWIVPHFEKMLYDNAEIPRAYLTGYRLTGKERYATVIEETLAFCRRELQHDDGAFFSTLDARSSSPDDSDAGDEEGAFYTWTPEEIHAVVDDETTAELYCDRYGVTERGNFERTTVLTESMSVDSLATHHDLDETTVEESLADAREQVFAAREERPRPARDEKILASWNGLLISTLAEASLTLDPEYAEVAAVALSFCREQLWDGEAGVLSRRYKDGEVGIDGYLEDYAFLARGALDTYGATGDVEHLSFALALAKAIVEHFWDAEARTLYFTASDGEALLARPQELGDQSTPSSAGVATDTLLALSEFAPGDRFETVAERVLETHADRIRGDPLQHASLLLAADRYHHGSVELTVAADAVPPAWRERIGRTSLPARLLAPRPADADGLAPWLDTLGFDSAPPIWADRDARDGEPTVYACREFACSPPQHDLDDALEWLTES